MGACFSRRKGRRPRPLGSAERRQELHLEPEALQEETVKEVLSETPRLKAPRPPKDEDIGINKDRGKELGRDDKSEETWEACSVSEGFSVSTSVTEVAGEDRPGPASPIRFQRKRSSSSGDILPKRERMTGSVASVGCRNGRSSPSPARRRESGGGSGGGGSGNGGRVCLAKQAPTAGKSRGNALCRDPGERSGRRSVSPAAKPSLGGQYKGVSAPRANGRSSPLRVGSGGAVEGSGIGGGGRRKMVQEMVEGGGARGGSGTAVGEKESLENPLVSLECFIFL